MGANGLSQWIITKITFFCRCFVHFFFCSSSCWSVLIVFLQSQTSIWLLFFFFFVLGFFFLFTFTIEAWSQTTITIAHCCAALIFPSCLSSECLIWTDISLSGRPKLLTLFIVSSIVQDISSVQHQQLLYVRCRHCFTARPSGTYQIAMELISFIFHFDLITCHNRILDWLIFLFFFCFVLLLNRRVSH